MSRIGKVLCLALLPLGIGCAQRTLDIDSEPEGALVFLNGEEVGRTPMRYYFEWYSNYDVVLRKEGYQTLQTTKEIKAPLYAIPPFDLLGEAFGAKDKRHWTFTLKSEQEHPVDPQALVRSGLELKGELRSSKYTRPPTTYPAATTRPTSRPSRFAF